MLVQGDLQRIVLTENLGQLLRLEGCLSGNLPQEGQPAAPVCREIAEMNAVRAVYGPATSLNESALQAQQFLTQRAQEVLAEAQQAAAAAVQAAREDGITDPETLRAIELAAGQEIIQNFQGELAQIAIETGQQSLPGSTTRCSCPPSYSTRGCRRGRRGRTSTASFRARTRPWSRSGSSPT